MFREKFRPETFSDILGMETAKYILKSTILGKDAGKAYLFTGESSSGKTTLARIFSKSILCLDILEDGSPCLKCSSCEAFREKRHPSYLEIDAGSKGGVEDINALKQDLSYESLTSSRVIVYDEAHRISKEGKDALLMELENPGSSAIFIFCTTEEDKMPPQLKSRCITLKIPKPSLSDVVGKLESICKVEEILIEDKDSLYFLAEACSTRYRDSENALEALKYYKKVNKDTVSSITFKKVDLIIDLIIKISADIKGALELASELTRIMQITDIYETILSVFVDAIKVSYGVDFENKSYKENLSRVVRCYESCLVDLMEYILNKDRLNNITTLQSDMILIHYRISKGQFKISKEEIQKQAKLDNTKRPADLINLIGKKSSSEINAKLRDLRYSKDSEGLSKNPNKDQIILTPENAPDQENFFKNVEAAW